MGEWSYSSSFLSLALIEGEWSNHPPADFPPGEQLPVPTSLKQYGI
jgi:hypothetical protein